MRYTILYFLIFFISANEYNKKILAGCPDISTKLLDELQQDDNSIKLLLCENMKTPHYILKNFLQIDSFLIQRALICHPSLTSESLHKMVKVKHHALRILLAGNPKINSKTISVLAYDSASEVRETIACRPDLSFEIFNILAKDKNLHVRCAIAKNKHTPINILEKIAHSKSIELIDALVENPNLSLKTRVYISKKFPDSTPRFRYDKKVEKNIYNRLVAIDNMHESLVLNKYTPADILYKIALQKNALFNEIIVNHRNINSEIALLLIKTNNPSILESLASNQNLPSSIFQRLANKEYLWPNLVRNPNTPTKIFERIINEETIAFIAKHPNTPLSLLVTLGEISIRLILEDRLDLATSIAVGLVKNNNSPAELLEKIYFKFEKENAINIYLANNTNIPRSVLEKLAEYPDERVAIGILDNPSVPKDVKNKISLLKLRFEPFIKSNIKAHIEKDCVVLDAISQENQCNPEILLCNKFISVVTMKREIKKVDCLNIKEEFFHSHVPITVLLDFVPAGIVIASLDKRGWIISNRFREKNKNNFLKIDEE